jgi:hypothetical protein
MPVVYFESLEDCDLVEVEFARVDGRQTGVRLFVDSGFTGASSFVLSDELSELALANLPCALAAGALSGRQQRVLVRCSIPGISFQPNLGAILTDVKPLELPAAVQGMAGLTFLRQFTSWGAERVEQSGWRFFLASQDEGK